MSYLLESLKSVPQRRSSHSGTWVPLYLEPIPGSGERLCIAVAAADGVSSVVVPVEDLERFSCVYGAAASALAWSANLVVTEAQHQLSDHRLESLSALAKRIDGLIVGEERRGAGIGLSDLARLALQQVSALTSTAAPLLTHDVSSAEEERQTVHHLDAHVRRLVVARRPEFKDRFGRMFRRSQSSRPLRYGYVGKFIAANFATLETRHTSQVSPQVDRAKARLWDLQQLNSGVLADSLPLHPESMSYELLVHRPPVKNAPPPIRSALKAAEEELEAEADKFDIRFHPLGSPADIAEHLVRREAA